MKTSTLKLLIIITTMSLFISSHLGATSIEEQCAARIKILDELNTALQKRSYSLRKRTLIRDNKSQLSLSNEEYKKLISSLKQQYVEGLMASQRGDNDEYRTKIVACLLGSGELLQKVKILVQSSGKELDNFSKNWRGCFPGYDK